jgi:hypothetical protein
MKYRDGSFRGCPPVAVAGRETMKRTGMMLAVALLTAMLVGGCVIVPYGGWYGEGYHYHHGYYHSYPYHSYR